MNKKSLKRTCYGCFALDKFAPCHCYLGIEVLPHKLLTKDGLVNTAKPTEPCYKPKSNRWYVWELEERINILEEVIRVLLREERKRNDGENEL